MDARDLVSEAIWGSLRALVLIGGPVILAGALVGTLSAALQASTSVVEGVITYAFKLVAVVVTMVVVFPIAQYTLIALAETVWK